MEFLKERPGCGALRLEGELNIQEAGRLKEALMKALAETNELSLDLGTMTGIDVACMQVLCSAHKTFLGAGKDLTIIGQPAASFEKVVDESGFRRKTGCHADPNRNCLWVIGGRHE